MCVRCLCRGGGEKQNMSIWRLCQDFQGRVGRKGEKQKKGGGPASPRPSEKPRACARRGNDGKGLCGRGGIGDMGGGKDPKCEQGPDKERHVLKRKTTQVSSMRYQGAASAGPPGGHEEDGGGDDDCSAASKRALRSCGAAAGGR